MDHGKERVSAACKDSDGNDRTWCLMKQRALPGQLGPGTHGGEGDHNPCGWDCRDGSGKGVQCAYDQTCLRISKDQTEVEMNVPHNMLVSGSADGTVRPPSGIEPVNTKYQLVITWYQLVGHWLPTCEH